MNETILQAIQRAGRSANGDIAVMIAAGIEAGLAARDVPGTIHYLVPFKFRMACGRRSEDSYSSASFWEPVTCTKCLEHKSHYGASEDG